MVFSCIRLSPGLIRLISMEDIYATVGAEVIIGFHNSTRYTGVMSKYVGFKTRIRSVYRTLYGRKLWCKVDADRRDEWWPVCDMILASDIDLLTPEQKARVK